MCVALFSHAGNAAEVSQPDVDFNRDVRPIFTGHCTACHGGVKQAADLSFVYRDAALGVVEPYDPDASYLIDRVISENPDERMPPSEHGRGLTEAEVDTLRRWIAQGASWGKHWAYEEPQRHDADTLDPNQWCRAPIDRFILARLEAEELQPADAEIPSRWLRRAYLDLIGLPPTMEERSEFLRLLDAKGEVAYELVVDDLLASPHFGERWATVWLDQIRYADSKGLGMDGRRNIWKYRDWVIQAFNDDMPYDTFTIKQIAGDLLPNPSIDDRIATAAHRLTQTNEEGGTDDEEFRVAAVLDRVTTTWQAWQGTTFGCVQCHNHPYDPFLNEEFYEFTAFFNNTVDCDLGEDWPVVETPEDPAQYERAGVLDNQIRSLTEQIWQRRHEIAFRQDAWSPITSMTAETSNDTQAVVEPVHGFAEFHTVGTVSKDTDFDLRAALPKSLRKVTAVRLTALPLDPAKALADSEWGFVLSHIDVSVLREGEGEPTSVKIASVVIDEPHPLQDPQRSIRERPASGFSAYTRIHYPREAVFIFERPVDVDEGAVLRVQLVHRSEALGAFPLIIRRGHLSVTGDESMRDRLSAEEITSLEDQRDGLLAERREIKSIETPVLDERPAHLSRPTYTFVRGLFLDKGEKVSANTPDALPPLPEGAVANRLTLAKWLVSPENPLTARVAVNRYWARLFGTGIVGTEEDFGATGEPPSHPDLLDDLAVRFREDYRWSTKKLLRELVLSSTYRQSARIRDDLVERDRANRLLARGPRRPLPAEMVRDQSLALSGLLSDRLFGPPVHPPIPDGIWMPFVAGDRWATPKEGDEDRYRRSIYTYTKRSIPYPTFAAFDAPTREFCTPRRLTSNTPIQALMVLNDAAFVECSQALADRLQQQEGTLADQLTFGFVACTCREPSESEVKVMLEAFRRISQRDGETVAWQSLASTLLNLDEILTK